MTALEELGTFVGTFDSPCAAQPGPAGSLSPSRQAARPLRYGSAGFKAVAILKSRPPGAWMSSTELALAAGLPLQNFATRMNAAVDSGELYRHPGSSRPARWSLGDPTQATCKPKRAPRRGPKAPNWKPGEAMERAKKFCALSPNGVRLRDMFFLGDANVTGDPLRMLANAIDAARALMSAKHSPTCRFKGAEVDVMVARELRAISEAAGRATLNLTQALEVMA